MRWVNYVRAALRHVDTVSLLAWSLGGAARRADTPRTIRKKKKCTSSWLLAPAYGSQWPRRIRRRKMPPDGHPDEHASRAERVLRQLGSAGRLPRHSMKRE